MVMTVRVVVAVPPVAVVVPFVAMPMPTAMFMVVVAVVMGGCRRVPVIGVT